MSAASIVNNEIEKCDNSTCRNDAEYKIDIRAIDAVFAKIDTIKVCETCYKRDWSVERFEK